jgi:hypothetical protein
MLLPSGARKKNKRLLFPYKCPPGTDRHLFWHHLPAMPHSAILPEMARLTRDTTRKPLIPNANWAASAVAAMTAPCH